MGILGHCFPDGPAAETASHYSGEFRSPISRWGLSGKLRPTLKRQNGMRFPVEVSSGKCIPESALGTGQSFPSRAVPEAEPQNPRSNWDAVSGRQVRTKLRWNSSWLSLRPAKPGTIPPQQQKPALATNVTCAGLVGAHKGTLQRPTSVMDYRTAPARDASVGLPSDEACRSLRLSAQCRQSADTAK